MAWKRQYFHLLGLEGQLIGNAARAGVVVHFASTGEVVCVYSENLPLLLAWKGDLSLSLSLSWIKPFLFALAQPK